MIIRTIDTDYLLNHVEYNLGTQCTQMCLSYKKHIEQNHSNVLWSIFLGGWVDYTA
jgi:hypothetical protein